MPYEITSNFTYLSSFVQFSAHLHHRFRELANLRYSPPSSLCSSTQQRIDLSKDRFPKTRILNLALYFIILSFPQLMLISSDWKYYLLLTIASLSSITYLYYLYQFVKESQ